MPYVIMHNVFLGDPVSMYSTTDAEGKEVPVVYNTVEEAEKEINEFLGDEMAEVEDGVRELDECSDRDEFTIKHYDPETGEISDLIEPGV